MSAIVLPRPARRAAGDLPRSARMFIAIGALLVFAAASYALLRARAGWAPAGEALKEVALGIHLATVLPALPLGAWVLLNRKGGQLHRQLGKVWLLLMVAAALSALGVRHLNNGRLSAVHLLVPVVLFGAWSVISTARRGDIAGHRRVLVIFFVTGLLVPGLAAFAPGRLMWVWLVG